MTTYSATVAREGDAWLADVPEVPGAHTYARTLTGLVRSIKEVIVLMADLPDDADPDVSLTFAVDDPVLNDADRVRAERQLLDARERQLRLDTASTARVLTSAGYSVRDAAVILGVTPGRISQLVNA